MTKHKFYNLPPAEVADDLSQRGGMARRYRPEQDTSVLIVPRDRTITSSLDFNNTPRKSVKEVVEEIKKEMFAPPKNQPKGPQQLRRFPVSRRLQGWK